MCFIFHSSILIIISVIFKNMIARRIVTSPFLLSTTNMMIRKVKPNQVSASIQSKLRSSNFITPLDLSNHQFDTNQQPIIQNNNKAIKHANTTRQTSDITPNPKTTHTPDPKKQPKKTNPSPIKTQIKQTSKPKLEQALETMGKALDPINTNELNKLGIEVAAIKQNKSIEKAISDMRKLQLKDFSVLVHRFLVNSSGLANTVNKYIWKQIQEDFLDRFNVTTDPKRIRSYSKIIYCLAKSKVYKDTNSSTVSTSLTPNLQSLQTKFALLLPSATHQSFSMIVTSLSRLGPLSQQFCYITQRLYYSKQSEFNIRQRIQINYALTRNNKMADSRLHIFIDSMNLKQILLMLRCYENCGVLYTGFKQNQVVESGGNGNINGSQILLKSQKNIILRKKEMNVIDISDICAIYFEAICGGYKIGKDFELMLGQMYELLKKNMNEVAFEKIWKNLPQVVNKGYLQIQFIEELIKTLKIMHKKQLFPERIWKPMRQTFKNFQNLQLRTKLQQIK